MSRSPGIGVRNWIFFRRSCARTIATTIEALSRRCAVSMSMSSGAGQNVESELEWRHGDLSSDVGACDCAQLAAFYASRWSGAGHLRLPRGRDSNRAPHLIVQMSPAGYSLAPLSSSRLRFTDRFPICTNSLSRSREICGRSVQRSHWRGSLAPAKTGGNGSVSHRH